jgi:predicted amidohydrolase
VPIWWFFPNALPPDISLPTGLGSLLSRLTVAPRAGSAKSPEPIAFHLAVGLIVAEDGRLYDAQTLHGPDGRLLGLYRKAHLFSLEKRQFAAGDSPLVVQTPIGRIGMSICYDLIFPEYIRRIVDLGADVVINSTDWITNSYQSSAW